MITLLRNHHILLIWDHLINPFTYVLPNSAFWTSTWHVLMHHSQLNGFDITQTIAGGQNYLKAIELYKNRYESH